MADPVKYRVWIEVEGATTARVCEHRQPQECSSSGATFLVRGKAYCQHHAESAVWDEALIGTYLKRIIVVEPYREEHPKGD